MPEKCPLSTGLYWENELEIPDFRQQTCGELITLAIHNGVEHGAYDYFSDSTNGECEHEKHTLETEDVSLQRGAGSKRIVGVTDLCSGCDMEYGAQAYEFECPVD